MEQLDLETAIAEKEKSLALDKLFEEAKVFQPVRKTFINSFTGEINQYKTPDNYLPDEGVVNDMPDLCHTEDHVSIAQMYARLSAMKALSLQDSDFDFDESHVSADDLDEDTISDVITGVDDPSDYDNYVNDYIADKLGEASNKQMSDSAGQKLDVESKNADEATGVAEEN